MIGSSCIMYSSVVFPFEWPATSALRLSRYCGGAAHDTVTLLPTVNRDRQSYYHPRCVAIIKEIVARRTQAVDTLLSKRLLTTAITTTTTNTTVGNIVPVARTTDITDNISNIYSSVVSSKAVDCDNINGTRNIMVKPAIWSSCKVRQHDSSRLHHDNAISTSVQRSPLSVR